MLPSHQSFSPQLPILRGSPHAASFADASSALACPRSLPMWAGAEPLVRPVEQGGGADWPGGWPGTTKEEGQQREDLCPLPPHSLRGAVPTGSQAKGGQRCPDKGAPPTPRRALAGLSAPLIHDSTFHLPAAREGRERPISQLTRLKGCRASGGLGGAPLNLY